MIWQSIYIMGNLNWSDYTRILTTLSRLENLVMVKMLNLRGTIINDNGSIAQLTMLDAKSVVINDCRIGDSAGNGRIENHIIRGDNIFIDNSEIYMLFVNVAIRSYCISFPVEWQSSLRINPQIRYKILAEANKFFCDKCFVYKYIKNRVTNVLQKQSEFIGKTSDSDSHGGVWAIRLFCRPANHKETLTGLYLVTSHNCITFVALFI